MKKLLILGLFIGASIITFAALSSAKNASKNAATAASGITVSGQVIDLNSGEALAGVEVMIEGSNKKALTDFDGKYTISDLKPGEYSIIASYISYNKSYIEKLNLRTNEAINIKLKASR